MICKGWKDIENRSWRIGRKPQHGPYSSRDRANFTIKLPERIYVHAGKNADWNEGTGDFLYRLFDADIPLGIPRLGTSPEQFGAIIGEVDIVDCVTESASPWFVGKYGFVLANPVLYEIPVPCPGRLGFFEVEDKYINENTIKKEGKNNGSRQMRY